MNKLLTLVAITVIGGMTAAHAEGAYVGIQGGLGGMNSEKATVANLNASGYNKLESKYRNSLAYRLSAGYLFGDQFSYGLEVGYANYGDNKDTYSTGANFAEVKSKGSYFDLLGVAKYNFNASQSGEGAYVVGKAGIARLSQKLETSSNNKNLNNVAFDENKWKPEVAVGAGYNFNKNLGVDVSFHHVFADGKTDYFNSNDAVNKKLADVNLLMVGLTYNFS